jgi:16S rRNA (cytidine1402-2'-O)-methyltransferase
VLYVCPTPIGNLRDITLRTLEVLGTVDVVACEDTRRTRGLLSHFDLHPARLLSFHEHNEAAALEALLGLMRAGREVALVTDAGMPGLSDPGFRLVRACVTEGLPLTVLPGPSAVSTAVVASGLPTDRFVFVGFLPRGKKQLISALEEADRVGATVTAFESPRRLRATLGAVAGTWPERRVAVCRELSKVHEEVVRGTAAEVLSQLAEPVRGEVVLVLEPVGHADVWAGTRAYETVGPAAEGPTREAVEQAVSRLLSGGLGTKDAAAVVASLTGMPSREAYRLVVSIKERRAGGADVG